MLLLVAQPSAYSPTSSSLFARRQHAFATINFEMRWEMIPCNSIENFGPLSICIIEEMVSCVHAVNPGHWTVDMRTEALEPAKLDNPKLKVLDARQRPLIPFEPPIWERKPSNV